MADKLEDLLQSGQISSRAARQMMTHEAERPNPARPYVEGAKALASGGLQGLANQRGIDTPEWSRRIGELMNSPEANAAIGAVTPMGKAAGSFIKAYHGSPHDFERFDMSKIGGGEGVQAYGHGLYFAENEGVAKSYRDKLSNWSANGKPLSEEMSALIGAHDGDLNAALKFRQDQLGRWEGSGNTGRQADDIKSSLRAEIKKLNTLSGKEIAPTGKMYEVGINAHPDEFLDWDKPLSEQHPKVQEALKTVGWDPESYTLPDGRLAPSMGGPKGRDVVKSSLAGDPEATSKALRDAGVPGIKYLDQNSRGADTGTRNYVVFHDNLVDIMKKYGMAGLSALPAAGAYHFQRQDPPAVVPDAAEQMPTDTQAAASYLK